MKINAKIKFILTLIVFGTVGIVSSFIPLSSSAIVFYRAILAALFLIAVSLFTHRKFGFKAIKENSEILLLAGIFMALNWVFQFEAFRYASVSVGTVCYNTMPIFVVLLSPMMFGEKLTIKGIACVIIATIGVILISNVFITGIRSDELVGCLYGIAGAFFYAMVVMVTKKMTALDSWDKIIVEFIIAGIAILPYMIFVQHSNLLFNEGISSNEFLIGIIMLLLLCFVHTGFCYIIYFDCVSELKAQEVALLTYIDPVVALILSAIILGERMNVLQIVGAVLILTSTMINEFVKTTKS